MLDLKNGSISYNIKHNSSLLAFWISIADKFLIFVKNDSLTLAKKYL